MHSNALCMVRMPIGYAIYTLLLTDNLKNMKTEIERLKTEIEELTEQKENTGSQKHFYRLINKIEDKKRELFY